jgi:hypothetical protein
MLSIDTDEYARLVSPFVRANARNYTSKELGNWGIEEFETTKTKRIAIS